MEFRTAGVIGGGAWGTALAQVAATGGRETLLWALEDDVVTAINEIHENPVYLKGLKLDPAIRATSSFSDLSGVDAWLVVTPAQHMRAVLGRSPCPNMPLVLCSKGIEEKSGKLLHEVAQEVCPSSPVAVLSGPTFAHEVAAGLPTAETALGGIADLRAGEAVTFDRGSERSAAGWSPWDFVEPGGEEDCGALAERLRRVVEHCVSAWASLYRRPLLSLSGGLDSSIVAACLAQAQCDASCLTPESSSRID